MEWEVGSLHQQVELVLTGPNTVVTSCVLRPVCSRGCCQRVKIIQTYIFKIMVVTLIQPAKQEKFTVGIAKFAVVILFVYKINVQEKPVRKVKCPHFSTSYN